MQIASIHHYSFSRFGIQLLKQFICSLYKYGNIILYLVTFYVLLSHAETFQIILFFTHCGINTVKNEIE